MKPKQLGILIVAVSFLLIVMLFSFNSNLNQQKIDSCNEMCGDEESDICSIEACPFNPGNGNSDNLIFIMGLLMAFIGGVGFYLIFSKTEKIVEEKVYDLTGLANEEKEVFSFVKDDDNGGVYQSKIVDELNFPKFKVTRILDRLEQKNLIERKRRGMTNIVVIK